MLNNNNKFALSRLIPLSICNPVSIRATYRLISIDYGSDGIFADCLGFKVNLKSFSSSMLNILRVFLLIRLRCKFRMIFADSLDEIAVFG